MIHNLPFNLPFGIHGITVAGHAFISKAWVGYEPTIEHEKVHIEQQRKWVSTVRFLLPDAVALPLAHLLWGVAYYTLAAVHRTTGPNHPWERDAYMRGWEVQEKVDPDRDEYNRRLWEYRGAPIV